MTPFDRDRKLRLGHKAILSGICKESGQKLTKPLLLLVEMGESKSRGLEELFSSSCAVVDKSVVNTCDNVCLKFTRSAEHHAR